MIIKGCSRGNPKQLAKHLLRTDTNGRVEVLELQSPAGDLYEALRDWQVLADGTRGKKGMYHANIDPDAKYPMTQEQWQRAVEILEAELGFKGQPRAVIFHEKHGRQHIHVVWQRTDIDTMTLKSDSWNYRAHEVASQQLEREFGHEFVPGKHAKRDRTRSEDRPRQALDHAEWQQAERTGLDPKERKEAITQLFAQCDTGTALKAALEEAGYVLAQGDRRDFVIVDEAGGIHSLSRQIKGVTAKDLREFMLDIDREKLSTAEEAKTRQLAAEPRDRLEEQKTPPEPKLTPDEIKIIEKALTDRHIEEARKLRDRQAEERAATAAILDREIREKARQVDAAQQAERDRYLKAQEKSGLDAALATLKEWLSPAAAAEQAQRQQAQDEAVLKRLEEERKAATEPLAQAKAADLADLDERHAQQRRDHVAGYVEERKRYLAEQEAAKRLLAELEERRRKLEEERSRDGPDRGPRRAR